MASLSGLRRRSMPGPTPLRCSTTLEADSCAHFRSTVSRNPNAWHWNSRSPPPSRGRDRVGGRERRDPKPTPGGEQRHRSTSSAHSNEAAQELGTEGEIPKRGGYLRSLGAQEPGSSTGHTSRRDFVRASRWRDVRSLPTPLPVPPPRGGRGPGIPVPCFRDSWRRCSGNRKPFRWTYIRRPLQA